MPSLVVKVAAVPSRILSATLEVALISTPRPSKTPSSIARQMVGNYVTSLEMPGVSVTLTRVDDELLGLFDAPARTPAWK